MFRVLGLGFNEHDLLTYSQLARQRCAKRDATFDCRRVSMFTFIHKSLSFVPREFVTPLNVFYTPPQKSVQDFAPSQVENVTMRRFY